MSINQIAEQAVDLVRHDAKAINIEFQVIQGDVAAIPVDRVQIAQVLVDLLCNRVEAINSAATIDQNASCIKVEIGEQSQMVKDHGPSVASDIALSKSFETIKEDGLGMGLSVSRSIVESYGGRRWNDATRSTGCTVSFTLPVDDSNPPPT